MATANDMKKLLIFIFACGLHNAYSQTANILSEFPFVRDSIEMDGYTYYIDKIGDIATYLYNANNRAWSAEMTYASGEPLPAEIPTKGQKSLNVTTIQRQTLSNIVDNSFSAEQIEKFDDEEIFISLHISPITGHVTDVYFMFLKSEYATALPVSIYREIELAIKSSFCFEVTDFGKNLNYCFYFWIQCPQGRIEVTPTIPDVNNGGIGGGGFTGNPIGNNTVIITSVEGR